MVEQVQASDSGALQRLYDAREYDALYGRISPPRLAFEDIVAGDACAGRTQTLPGYCRVCDKAVHFQLPADCSDPPVNFRESLVCPTCGLTNRQRFVAAEALAEACRRGEDSRVYVYEQRSQLFAAMQERLGARLTGSEYLGPEVGPGQIVDGIRNEDATSLTFEGGSFDVLVSNDVFEHVPDIERAFAEARRVLRSDGVLLFSIPFHATALTEQRVRMSDGELLYLAEPEYHGDPLRSEGALVFYHFGWDILDMLKKAGFADAFAVAYYSVLYGHIGRGMQLGFRAEA